MRTPGIMAVCLVTLVAPIAGQQTDSSKDTASARPRRSAIAPYSQPPAEVRDESPRQGCSPRHPNVRRPPVEVQPDVARPGLWVHGVRVPSDNRVPGARSEVRQVPSVFRPDPGPPLMIG
jgi:hypothetical protein